MNNVNKLDSAEEKQLREILWRRAPTAAEAERLRRGGEWEEEAALTRALTRLPDAPVSSNFTALVMEAAERAGKGSRGQARFDLAGWLPRSWGSRLAMGAAMVGLSLLTIREYQDVQRERTARELAGVSRLATLPPVDWLQNFETISRLNRVKVADEDLLLVLQ